MARFANPDRSRAWMALLACLAAASPAGAQSLMTEDDLSAAAGRFVNGPFTWTPTLTLRDAGVDTNIFAVPTNEKRDTTASIMPAVDARLALGALRGHSKGHLEYLYFERYTQQRALNGQVEARFEMPERRVRPLVRVEWARLRDRSSSEVEMRVPRREHELAGALETRVAPRTWVGAGVARRVIDYDPGYAFEGADLARQLNRTEDTATAAMRTALSPFTTLTAQVSVGWDMFDLQPERDTNNVRANIGFQLDWRELLEFPDVQRVVDRELDVCARVGRIIVPCPEAFDELVRCDARFQALRPRVQHVLTGGRRRSTTATHSPAEVRARFGLPLDQPVGLFLGNREPYRGLDRLLNGILALDEPRVIPGVIAVAGPDVDAVPRSARVRPLGRVDDVASLLTAVDFVVNTNRFSLFDLSLVEAVEAGLPLLVHDTGGNRAFARLGAGTVMLPDLEAATVAAGLEDMFTRRASDLRRLGERSRACYERSLTLESFRHGHRALYASEPRSACA